MLPIRVVAGISLALLLPPVWLMVVSGSVSVSSVLLCVVALLPGALLPGALLRRIRYRRLAVVLALAAASGYVGLLVGLLGPSTAPLAGPPAVGPPIAAPVVEPAAAPVAEPVPGSLAAWFAPFGVETVSAPLVDFGRLRSGAESGPIYAVSPTNAETLQQVVARAYEHDVPMRIRGRGHSMNGSSLPRPDELLIRSVGLSHVRFERPGTVTVEGGVPIHDLRQVLQRYGYDIPVYNDGTADGGPSIGGYINAGGFGPGSAKFGGFWENVDAVTLVVADGERRTLERVDSDFPWVFGAMGQLGVVLEARLDIYPAADSVAPSYPEGKVIDVTQELVLGQDPRTVANRPDATSRTPIYWFTLFISPEQAAAAARALAQIQERHAGELSFRPAYTYPIHHRAAAAPLVYGIAGDFVAIGIWGDSPAPGTVEAIDAEVATLARSTGYRRYVQAEILTGPEAYRDYFDTETYQEFMRRRRALDPKGLFNRGSVFPE
jgi:FAD/FMN-containing dehydrogenase